MMEARANEPAPRNRTTVERTSDRELVVSRTFDGPARIVFDVWTRPELLKRWWAPRSLGVSLFSCEVDLRAGGRYRYVFGRDPKAPMAFSGTFTEVTPCSRVVSTQVFEPMRAAGEAVVTATFEEHGGKTRLVLHQLYPSKESLDGAVGSGMERGMLETFDQLEGLVATLKRGGPPELILSRTFDAPRRLVFQAWTKAEHVARWFTPRPLTTARCEVDFTVGGVFLVVMRMPGGSEHDFTGRFTEIDAPARLAFSGTLGDGNRIETSVAFIEEGAKTKLTVHQTYAFESDATRGASLGWKATLDQLGEEVSAMSGR
jgi:uncharacterized protein YndB with AHSA1/START domain